MIILYGIKNCDNIKKSRKWLDKNSIEYVFHDFRIDGIKKTMIKEFIENIEIKFNKGDWKSLNCKPMVGEMKFKWKGIKRVKENKVIKIIFNIAYTLFLRLNFDSFFNSENKITPESSIIWVGIFQVFIVHIEPMIIEQIPYKANKFNFE